MKPFVCTTCRTTLGYTDGSVLVIGVVRIETPVILHCLSCGDGSRKREWRPLGINSKADEKRARLAQRMNERAALVMTALSDVLDTH